MSTDSVRSEFERAVKEWLETKDEKAETDRAYNESLKKIEQRIRTLSRDLAQEAAGQQRLPFEGSAPDLERLALEARLHGITKAERNDDGSTTFTVRSDGGLESQITLKKSGSRIVFADSPTAPQTEGLSPVCATCEHFSSVHVEETGQCMLRACKCKRFVPKDPLGVDGVDPQAESEGASDAAS